MTLIPRIGTIFDRSLRAVLVPAVVIAFQIAAARGEESRPIRAAVPEQPAARCKIEKNERYSSTPGRAGLCDVYLPLTPAPSSGHPVVVLVHGGAWISGDKWMSVGYARLLAENGIVAVAINYRLAPAHKFPAQVDDVRDALVWTRKNARRFSIDLDRLGLFGYSAGGHLAALTASLVDEPMQVRTAASGWTETDRRWQQLPTIRAVCAGGPPADFRVLPPGNTSLAYFLGGSRREKPDVYVAASPAAHVSAADPVTQIIHGESDLLVPIGGSRRFHQAQVDAGIDSRFEVMENQGHMVTFISPKTQQKTLEFFRETLGAQSGPIQPEG